jgi:hypothetical protein
MVDNGVIQHLKYVMRSKSIDVQREAARALANISAEYTCEYARCVVLFTYNFIYLLSFSVFQMRP